jgi:hypothetical protein
VRNLVRAVVTTPIFLVGHLIRSRDIERSVEHVAEFSEPSPRPSVIDDDAGVQTAVDGEGPIVMRSYSIIIEDPDLSSDRLIDHLIADPNALNARSMAGFVVDDRPATDLRPGDRLVVELAGPWNGPVLVERADEDAVLLSTLDGHMEAGRIRFDTLQVRESGSGTFVFRITSWARAGDRAFQFLHLRLPIGRELQTAMWVAMCRKAAAASNGRGGPITVRTEILDRSPGQ